MTLKQVGRVQIQDFPDFLIQEIFSYLPPIEIVKLRLVSNTWNYLGLPFISKCVNFASRLKNLDDIEIFYKKFGRYARAFDFNSLSWLEPPLSNKLTKLVTSNCQNVRALKIGVLENWYVTSELILAFAKTQRQFNHLSLSGPITKEFLVSISPALEKLETIELGYFCENDFQLGPLLKYLTCPILKIFTLWWYVFCDEDILDKIRAQFSTLKLINYGQYEGNSSGVKYFCTSLDPLSIRSLKIQYPDAGFATTLDFQHDAPPLLPSSDSVEVFNQYATIIGQLSLVNRFFVHETSFENFKVRFPKIKKADFTFWNQNDMDYRLVLTQLDEVEILIIESCDEIPGLIFSNNRFHAKVLSMNFRDDMPPSYMEWVAQHFHDLQQLYLHEVQEPWNTTDFHFRSLMKLHSNVSQSLSFWESVISSSPKLKYIYLPKDDPHFNDIEVKFPTVRVLVWQGIEQNMDEMHHLSGFDSNAEQVLSLLN